MRDTLSIKNKFKFWSLKMEHNLSRRGLPTYAKNPSAVSAIANQQIGVKRFSSGTGTDLIISNAKNGEVYSGVGLGFHTKVKVDKTQFVKLYIEGVSAFVGLSKAGGRVLEAVISEINKTIGKDTIYISQRIADSNYGIKKSTFMSGMRDLLMKEILFEHLDENWYFVNVNYMFNGDRLAFLKTYEIENLEGREVENSNQAQLPFDSEIDCSI